MKTENDFAQLHCCGGLGSRFLVLDNRLFSIGDLGNVDILISCKGSRDPVLETVDNITNG